MSEHQTTTSGESHRPVLMLVDGYGLIFRAYHAIPHTLSTAQGEQTNAVFGFASMLLEALRSQRPTHAVIALEGGRTFRHDEFEAYKANRASMPDDLRPQVNRVIELAKVLNIPIEQRDGYEADDVIGSLAARCTADDGLRALIVTGDSDLLQLVNDNVDVVLPGVKRFGELRLFDRAAVEARYGFGPELVPDYKALVGDTSDNIPGVPGIGDKTAKVLIARFGSLESIIEHLDEVAPPRAQNALRDNTEQAIASKRLATIVRDLDVEFDLDRSAIGNYDREAVIDFFRNLEFRTLVNNLPELDAGRASAAPPKIDRPPAERTIVRTDADMRRLAERLAATETYAIDVETDSTDPVSANLVGIAIAVNPAESYYIPLGHRPDPTVEEIQLELSAVQDALGALLADPARGAYTHHGKFDIAVLRRHGIEIGRLAEDSMISAYLLNETSTRLKDLAFTRLGVQMTEITELIGTGRNQLTMDRVPSELAGPYACGDVESTFALVETFQPEIEARELGPLLHEIELPLVPVLVDMEQTGIAVDAGFLAQMSKELTERAAELEREIHSLAGREIKISSNKQLATLLFEELKLSSGRRTKTGFSVDVDVLEAIRDAHPIVEAILEYRSIGKLKSTYVDALPLQINPATGRVHTSFNQTIAATGRLSSINPNLQNIPIRTELGRRVRHAFFADRRPEYRLFDDAVLLSADYSQIELRLLAHLSQEPFLIEAFQRNDDIHRATAAIVNGIEPGEVTPEMRRVAKTVNFGVLYGMQAYGLSRDTGLARADAQRFIDEYWARLPAVRNFFDQTLRFGAVHGYVRAESGRRRPVPDLTSTNGARRIVAERVAINMPLQGGAADIMKIAMIRLWEALQRSNLRARMLLQVHDELVLEVDQRDLMATARLVCDQMVNAVDLRVPLDVELHSGTNWEELEPVDVSAAVA